MAKTPKAAPKEAAQQGFFGKYKGLAFSLIMLVILVISLLVMNLVFSKTLQSGTQIASASTRQSALLQEIAKDLFLINSQYQKVLPYDKEKKSLKKAVETFDSTLKAFSEGGLLDVDSRDGFDTDQVQVQMLDSGKSVKALKEASVIWEGYLESVKPILEGEGATQIDLLNARDFADEKNERLSFLMDELSDEIQVKSDKSIFQLRMAQIVGIVLTALMFLYTVFVTGRNLKKNDKEIDQARQETQGILDTVKEGLFLVDKDLVISSQHSKEMLQIFEIDSISGSEFSGILRRLISSKELDTVEEFVKLLFDDHIIEDLIGSLNPLDKIEMIFDDPDGGQSHKKFLNFNFFRVTHDGVIDEVLVSVRDITSQVLLEQELESTKEQGEQQVEMLVSFLKADPKMLKSFLSESQKSLSEVNGILKDPVVDKVDLKAKIDKMFISVHRMKGEAASMNFDAFADKAHEFESDLSDLKRVTNIKGIDFLPLTIRLDNLISYADTLKQLSNRLEGGEGAGAGDIMLGDTTIMSDSVIVTEYADEWMQLDKLAATVANDTGKQVRLIKSGFLESSLDEEQFRMVKDVCIQLLRNSIVHGIETPEARQAVNKPTYGRLDLRLATLPDGGVELVVRDDGKGLDVASISKRIISKGLATAADLKTWTTQKIISMAFSSGFSTSTETSMHAGRGVGLDIIRDSVKNIGGEMKLRQAAGKYCQFEILLPGSTENTE